MRQATLAAFYGPKTAPLAELIAECQCMISASLRDSFKPYSIDQVHATVIGLERHPNTIVNENFLKHRGLRLSMDISGFRTFLLGSSWLPLTIQLGGFQNRDYPFSSRNAHPYERSFSFQGEVAVVVGWPRDKRLTHTPVTRPTPASWIQAVNYPNTLDDMRRGAQAFGILHAWHRKASDIDNDFYLRLGMLAPIPDSSDLQKTQEALRRTLSQRGPLVITVQATDLFLIGYDQGDSTLPPERTTVRSLLDERDPVTLFAT